MSEIQHRELAEGRWFTLTLCEQLGHVGSEVSRACRWKDRDAERSRAAFHRALELLDLTRADPRHRTATRLRELGRAREVMADFFAGDNQFGSTAESLQKYFDAFAVASRLRSTAERRIEVEAAERGGRP